MKTKKTYKQTRFAVSTIRDALRHVGVEGKLFHNTVRVEPVSNSFDNIEDWLLSFEKPNTGASLNFEGKQAELSFHSMLTGDTEIEITSKERAVIDTIFAIFDAASPSAAIVKLPAATVPKGIDVDVICEIKPLHWQTLPLLKAHLSTLGLEVNSCNITLNRFPMDVTYSEWTSALKDIQENGEPKRFSVNIHSSYEQRYFRLKIIKDYYTNSDEIYLRVWVSGVPSIDTSKDIIQFLGLVAAEVKNQDSEKVDKTAFIAHRFDEQGEQIADRLARFLTLLGFDVKTGRGFAPKSVSEKVKERLKAQAITFVILSPGEDATWLTQESVLGLAGDKHIFILKESSVEFKPGIFGDVEFIPFSSSKVESTFIPILEGLKEIGFDPSAK